MSLHVGTAVWQAQLAGTLPRDPLAQRGDLTPEARGALRLMRDGACCGSSRRGSPSRRRRRTDRWRSCCSGR